MLNVIMLNVIILSAILLSVIRLNVIMLSVILLSVVASSKNTVNLLKSFVNTTPVDWGQFVEQKLQL